MLVGWKKAPYLAIVWWWDEIATPPGCELAMALLLEPNATAIQLLDSASTSTSRRGAVARHPLTLVSRRG